MSHICSGLHLDAQPKGVLFDLEHMDIGEPEHQGGHPIRVSFHDIPSRLGRVEDVR